MRTDVKLGIGLSMIVVLVAGGYFLFRGKGETPVPVAQKTAAVDPSASKNAPAKPTAAPTKPRQVLTGKDTSAGKNLPVGPASPDGRLAHKPVDRPPTTPASGSVRESPSAPLPPSTSMASAPAPKPTLEPVRTDVPSNATLSPSASERLREASGGASTGPLTANPSASLQPSISSLSSSEPVASPSAAPPSTGANLPATLPLNSGSPPVASLSPTSSSPSPSSLASAGKPDVRPAATDTHKVQPGDSLASLAQTYYGNSKYSKFLADANPQFADPTRLALGTLVKIPPLPADVDAKSSTAVALTTAKTGAPAAGKRTYKVQPGDSFYRIAREQLGSPARWKELFALNKSAVHGDPTQLQAGQTLVLPES